jgi:hypothetical protein
MGNKEVCRRRITHLNNDNANGAFFFLREVFHVRFKCLYSDNRFTAAGLDPNQGDKPTAAIRVPLS